MKLETLLPLLAAILGGGGFVGILTAIIGRKNHKDDKQVEMLDRTYERNVYLEERIPDMEKKITELRFELAQKNSEIWSLEHKVERLQCENQELRSRLKEKRAREKTQRREHRDLLDKQEETT